jgi:cytochrome P450
MAIPKLKPVPIPGPPTVPVLGFYGNMMRLLRDPVAFLDSQHQRYGRISAIAANNPFMVYALGPEFNQLLLGDPKQFYTVDASSLFSVDLTGTSIKRLASGVVMMNGPKHLRQRRLIMPALHRNALPQYWRAMVETTNKVADAWRPGQTVDIFQEMQKLTLSVAMKVLLGLEGDPQQAEALGKLYKEWMTLASSLSTLLFPVNFPGSPFRSLLKLSDRLETHALNAIEKRRKNPGNDVLSMLIHARDEDGSVMSEEELIGNAHVLFIIGHQTMTDVLTWTFFLLSQHPEVLAELMDELDGELHGAPPTFEQLGKLPLLDRVIEETLRLLGPTIYQYRVSQAPFQLGPYEMPAGSWVIFSPHYTHRLPEIFPEPNRFVPRRWETAKPTPYEYLPFTYGAHGCLGPSFAMMEMKIVVATILQRFRLMLAPGARIDRMCDPTLCPKNGMPMVAVAPGQPFQRVAPLGNIHEMVVLS